MSTIVEDAFEDGGSEVVLSHRIETLQEIVCHLLRRNEELREAVRELRILQPESNATGEDSLERS
jgi:hypothetical protein